MGKGGGEGDMTTSPVIGGGSKTKVPLDLDSFWNYTKVIIKDYGLHFDLIDNIDLRYSVTVLSQVCVVVILPCKICSHCT